jgi:hypothetical protein
MSEDRSKMPWWLVHAPWTDLHDTAPHDMRYSLGISDAADPPMNDDSDGMTANEALDAGWALHDRLRAETVEGMTEFDAPCVQWHGSALAEWIRGGYEP